MLRPSPVPLPAIPGEYLSIPEVAHTLHVSRQYAWQLARSGRLRAARFGGVTRIHRDDLIAFIREGYAHPAPIPPDAQQAACVQDHQQGDPPAARPETLHRANQPHAMAPAEMRCQRAEGSHA
jgi:excisionase family DNA binding protein